MATITLTPKIYKKGMKHSLLSANKIDTVKLRPISNRLAENTIFHTTTLDKVNIENVEYVLPISTKISATDFHSSTNYRWGGLFVGNKHFAKARVECVVASGTTLCKTDEVVQGTVIANVRLAGNSKRVARGGSTFDNYPSADSLSSKNYSLSEWIDNNKTETVEGMTHDYTGNLFSLNPWVRNIVHFELPKDIDWSTGKPTANDVVTDWASSNGGRNYVFWTTWNENSSTNLGVFEQFEMGSPSATSLGVEEWSSTRLVMHNVQLPILKELKKLDDYNYEVSWTVPIRVAYAAASREFGPLGGAYDIDNYAYLDEVSSITIELSGTPLSTDVQNIAYSSSDGELTKIVKDNYTVEVDASEALTLDTRKGMSDVDGLSGLSISRGGYLNAEGEWIDQPQAFATDYVFLPRNSVCTVLSNTSFIGCVHACYYDLNRKFIDSLVYTCPDGQLVFPSTVDKYVRLNGNIADIDSGDYYITIRKPNLWTEVLAKDLLDKYDKGKYTVDCAVAAAWAIDNDIKVNSKVQVKLLDGTFISRGSEPCTFEIKNIEKRYEQHEFVFELKLLEV